MIWFIMGGAALLSVAWGVVLWRLSFRFASREKWIFAISYPLSTLLLGIITLQAAGVAKPLWSQWPVIERATIAGVAFDEGKAIYLWLRVGKAAEPIAYSLPWSERIAGNIATAYSEAADGQGIEVEILGGDPYGEFVAHPKPQPAMPPKDIVEGPVYLLPQQELPQPLPAPSTVH